MSRKCAIVFGASGISGIAMTKSLLASDEWGPIICVSRTAPQLATNDSRIEFVSADMVKSSADDLASKLSAAGAAVAQHAFFYTYIEKPDPKEFIEINKMLLQKALHATGIVAPKLKSFMLQTGTKVYPLKIRALSSAHVYVYNLTLLAQMQYYGNHLGGDQMVQELPWKEDAPRPVKEHFYYEQEDLLKIYAVSKNWRWLVTRPGVILGVSKGLWTSQ